VPAVDPATIPEDLSPIGDADLDQMGSDIAEAIDSLASELPADGRLTDEHDPILTQIEALDTAGQRVAGEIEERSAQSEGRRQRLDSVLTRLHPAGEEAPPEGEPQAEGEPAPTGETAPVQQAAAVEPAQPPAPAPAPVPAQPRSGSLATLRRPEIAKPKAGRSSFMQATANAVGINPGTELEDPMKVAEAICKKRHNMGNIPSGVSGEFVSVAQGLKDLDGDPISPSAEDNYDTFRALREGHQALVAAGPCCAPFTPMYDFYRLAQPQNPVEGAIPTVPAPRGGIRYIPGWCDLTEALGAIGTQACADFDPNDPPDPKPCARVSCPDTEEVSTTAVSQCLYFDNLQYRVFPELVAAFLEDVAVAFTMRKEQFYLDFIDAHSTHVTGGIPYGAARSVLYAWTTAAMNYRSRQRMPRQATLDVFAPDWLLDLMRLDAVMDGDSGMDNWNITEAALASFLGQNNLNVTWYADTATGAGQRFDAAQAAGAQNLPPTHVRAYLFSPGTFARIDGGTLDVGLVRDSTLNRSNDLQLFMEEWIGNVMLGCESIALTTTVCANGARPDYVTPFTCA
jgi:hypothetical protein